MSNEKIHLYKLSSLGELFSITKAFIKQNYKQYLKLLFIYAFPFKLLAELIYFICNIPESIAVKSNSVVRSFSNSSFSSIGDISYFLLSTIGSIIAVAITMKFVQLYIKNDNFHLLNVKDIWKLCKKDLGWIFLYFFFVLIVSSVVLYFIFIIFTVAVMGLSLFTSISNGSINLFASIWKGVILLSICLPILMFVFTWLYVVVMFNVNLKMEMGSISFSKAFGLLKNNRWKIFIFTSFSFALFMAVPYLIGEYLYVIYFVQISFKYENTVIPISFFIVLFNSFAALVSYFFYLSITILFYSLFSEKNNDLTGQFVVGDSGLNQHEIK